MRKLRKKLLLQLGFGSLGGLVGDEIIRVVKTCAVDGLKTALCARPFVSEHISDGKQQ